MYSATAACLSILSMTLQSRLSRLNMTNASHTFIETEHDILGTFIETEHDIPGAFIGTELAIPGAGSSVLKHCPTVLLACCYNV